MTKYNRVVILGAAGFIGYHLAKSLAVEAKVDLLLVDNFIRGANDEDFLKLSGLQNVNFAELDLSKESSFENLFNKSDLVINCAALNGTQNFYQVPLDVMLNTGISAFFAARYAALAQVHKYIYLGSSESYAGGVNLGFVSVPTSESVPLVIENVENIRWSYSLGKTFGEVACYSANSQLNLNFQILRIHNIYGPNGTWDGGREKAPAAICRKIAKLKNSDQEIEVWGDGLQTRSFLYVADCIEATRRLMKSNFMEPINIGSEEMVTINELIDIVAEIASKPVKKKHKLDAPTGVRGRNSDNRLIRSVLHWDFEISLRDGLKDTYHWINNQISKFDS